MELGNYVVIGGMTPIHQFVKIGDYAMIAGASAISQDIPPFCLAEGNRAVVRSLNKVGLKRNFEQSDVLVIQSAYRTLFRGTKPIRESATELLVTQTNAKVRQLCQFILESKRGIPFERKNDGE